MAANPGQPSGQNLLQRILNIENLLGINGASNALFRVADANGVQRVRIGLLPNGDYGILFNDVLGNTQELLPTVTSFAFSNLSTSSTTPATVAGSPSVTFELGASGNAIVSVGSNISSSSAGVGGLVYIVLDGVTYAQFILENLNQDNASCFAQLELSQVFGVQKPGKHTITLQYSVHAAGTALFFANVLTVEPV